MAIKITSDNREELIAVKYIFELGIMNTCAPFLEKNNLPTKIDVTYELDTDDSGELDLSLNRG